MRLRSSPTGAGARDQRGFALIAVLALAALISAYLITTALNPTGSELIRAREQRSMNALRQAKAALIAYAASEQWQNTGGVTPFQPGALPCPDRDDNGTAEDREFPQSPCNTSLKRIGRFPWRTVGAEDLRDASGERLWYAVSSSFLRNTPLYTNVVNSDTPGQLTVNGTAPASNVVAIVFAPEDAFQYQSRVSTNAVTYNDPANFLEQFDTATYATFRSSQLLPPPPPPLDVFNDRLIVITQADLMEAVEPIVAANIERDVKPRVQDYVDPPSPPNPPNAGWGRYPFAAPFGAGGGPGRAQSEYKGSAGQTNGLLPVTTEAGWVAWRTSPLSAITVVQTGGTGTVDSVDCSSSTSTQIVCRVNYSGFFGSERPRIRLDATLLNAANSFVNPLAPGDATMTKDSGGMFPAAWTSGPTVTNTAQGDGNGAVAFSGRLDQVSVNSGRVYIRVPVPSYHAITSSTDPISGWFIANEWYRQTYFAVAPGWLPGAAGSCFSPNCITANNLPPGYTPADNKRAILVLSGLALNGATRPTNNPADYFEGENFTPVDRVYEHRVGPIGLTALGAAINDRVVVLSP